MTAIFASGLGSTPRLATKTVTLTGAAGLGAQGTVSLYTVTGRVLVQHLVAFNPTTFVSGGAATVAMGVTGSTSLFVAATAYTQFTGTANAPGLFWTTTSTAGNGVAVPAALKDIEIARDIILTIATADITAGVLETYIRWVPLSAGSGLVAA